MQKGRIPLSPKGYSPPRQILWEASLKCWRKITKNADWKNFEDVKRSWKNVDKVGSCVVFDIQHNRCRLVARIFYKVHRVYILRIIGHPEYMLNRWKSDCRS